MIKEKLILMNKCCAGNKNTSLYTNACFCIIWFSKHFVYEKMIHSRAVMSVCLGMIAHLTCISLKIDKNQHHNPLHRILLGLWCFNNETSIWCSREQQFINITNKVACNWNIWVIYSHRIQMALITLGKVVFSLTKL